MNRLAWVGIMAFVFLFLACSVSRKRMRERLSSEGDSVSVIRIDHFSRKGEIRASRSRSVALRQVLYARPDSLGRQYPLSVTTASVHDVSEHSSLDTCVVSSVRDSSAIRVMNGYEMKEVEQEREVFPRWGWWMGGIVLAGFVCVCLYRYNKTE